MSLMWSKPHINSGFNLFIDLNTSTIRVRKFLQSIVTLPSTCNISSWAVSQQFFTLFFYVSYLLNYLTFHCRRSIQLSSNINNIEYNHYIIYAFSQFSSIFVFCIKYLFSYLPFSHYLNVITKSLSFVCIYTKQIYRINCIYSDVFNFHGYITIEFDIC